MPDNSSNAATATSRRSGTVGRRAIPIGSDCSLLCTILLTAFVIGAMYPSLATASEDRSPKPGGIFKLKPGIYVDQRSTCGDPANAAIRSYDGKGIATSSTHGCRARITDRNGKSLGISQSCTNLGSGPAGQIIERFRITIENALEFTISINTKASTYRYCPPEQLPERF